VNSNLSSAGSPVKRAIEEGFPIVEINRLAVPERNSFKPIYQMHKWFARRASCVFRAILLGCLKPAGTDIMAEFYKDHTHDPDTAGKVVLDPFMGGGTTVVEALRLGCKVIGIDLNPVAWFVVKTEVEPVDLEELRAAFDRLAAQPVSWSGKPLRETLLDQYKTACPCCGNADADIIYTFWVKSAPCTNAAPPCEKKTLVPLFSDYVVARKSPSVRYWRDARCPRCDKTFDWETEPATLVAEPDLMVTSPAYSAGVGRSTTRWAYSPGSTVQCPWCNEQVAARPAKGKRERKKVPLTVLLCPFCETVWQWRGDVPDQLSCPACHRSYDPQSGNVPDKGKFLCPVLNCGTKDKIINAIRQFSEDRLLPMHPYAIQGYCGACGGDARGDDPAEEQGLFDGEEAQTSGPVTRDHSCLLTKSNGKFFAGIRPADLARYQAACALWEREKHRLPYPKPSIPEGFNTNQMIKHHYRYWHQLFNARQLLCLSTLLSAISGEQNQTLKELLLCAFSNTLEANNLFTRNIPSRATPGGTPPAGIFARHDFQPKLTLCEQNVWGSVSGNNTFTRRIRALEDGLVYRSDCWDNRLSRSGEIERGRSVDRVKSDRSYSLYSADSRGPLGTVSCVDLVVTDPPFLGNVNYAELSDFFYVWLRLMLSACYSEFVPDHTPKHEEIIANPTRGKTLEDFRKDLGAAFAQCRQALKSDGMLVFTFHHSEGEAWVALLQALCDAGFAIENVYPVHGEREASLHLLDKEAIAYDLIHVCRRRPPDASTERRSWAGLRQQVRRLAREEVVMIEAGRYGKGLAPEDVNIILIGKCLELYSRHYGAVVDYDGNPFELRDALKEIRNLVDQLVTKERPLPPELEDIDAESRIYLLALCDTKEVKADDLHKATRGVLEPDDLMAAGLIVKGRAGRGRTYEVKQPADRFPILGAKFRTEPSPQADLVDEGGRPKARGRVYFIDYIHFLMALADGGEPLVPWLERFRGETPRLRASCDYLAGRNKAFAPALKKVRDLLDVGPLFPRP
jgi:putative DNA methylase